MLFNSYVFMLAFLPLTLLIYFLLGRLPERIQLNKLFLVLASFVFYGYNNPSYVPIIVCSILVNYVLSQMMLASEKKAVRLPLMLLGLFLNLGVLFYFKYHDFFASNMNTFFGTSWALYHLALPLGISFFTFQQLSYVIDSYRRTVPRYNILDYALFVTFFPQLVAGPIVLHSEIVPQFADKKNRHFNFDHFAPGLYAFALGLFKKVIVADTFGIAVEAGFADALHLNTIEAWFIAIGYTLQLYFDFSGYCDVATSVGLHPIQFGIMMVLNCGIGLLTPPVGAVLFIGSAVAKRPIGNVVKATLPFYLCMIITLLLISYIPQISLFLPQVFGGYTPVLG